MQQSTSEVTCLLWINEIAVIIWQHKQMMQLPVLKKKLHGLLVETADLKKHNHQGQIRPPTDSSYRRNTPDGTPQIIPQQGAA